jgi:hypothetical protein
MFGSSDGAGVADDFVHQWCAGRATLQFGRNVFYAGALVCCFVTCVALLIIIPSTVEAEGNLFDLNEFKIQGQLSHLNSACLNLSSYDLRQKVRQEPAMLCNCTFGAILKRLTDCGCTFGVLRQQAAGVAQNLLSSV